MISNRRSLLPSPRPPDLVAHVAGGRSTPLTGTPEAWSSQDLSVQCVPTNGALRLSVTAAVTPIERLVLRWREPFPANTRFLGDHWERGYGDLEWRALVPERVMPWYFLATGAGGTSGFGVRVQPAAFCSWTVDEAGFSLWLDLRNGGTGVELRGRTLNAAEVVFRAAQPAETPFQAAGALCRQLCATPRLADHPVYGSNNWYYAYGVSSHGQILEDARILADLAPATANRPYLVIDAGWQARSGNDCYDACCGAPWDRGNAKFPDMPGLAAAMKSAGTRPGLWLRPLAADPETPENLLLPVERATDSSAKIKILDPSQPENLARIRADFRRAHDWGYALIKHDWSSCDILGRWGFQFGAALTNDGWHFHDRTRTTAEITLALFAALREGAADSVVIGCNTFSHLAAGFFEVQRTGDDTSGRVWERTRKMGINTLAFRMSQHEAFYAADADCVGLTLDVPWNLNRQWLDLLARSGTPLFVSADPKAMGREQRDAVKAAFVAAAAPQPAAEPLDWMGSTCPSSWKIGNDCVRYDWYEPAGVNPVWM
jgi:alpha-galactosidase